MVKPNYKTKLTDALIGRLEFEHEDPKKQVIVWDTEVPDRFGVRIYPSGKKKFLIMYYAGGRPRYLTLGTYGNITLKQARDAARARFGEIAMGRDPAEEKKKQRERERTVGDLLDEYLELDWVKAKATYRDECQRIRRHMRPALGSKRVLDVTKKDVQALHDKVSKTAPQQANKVLTLISTIWKYAISEGYTGGKDVRPTMGVRKNPENTRKRFVTDEELPKLIKEILALKNPVMRVLFLLYWSLAKRRGELRTARWEDLDVDAKTLVLRDTKNSELETVHLGDFELSLLSYLPRIKGNPYIFPGNKKGQPVVNVNWTWDRLRKRAGVPDLWIHDFRRRWTHDAHEAGIEFEVASKGLAHKSTKVTKKHYAQHVDPLQKKLIEARESHSRAIQERVGEETLEEAFRDTKTHDRGSQT